MYDRDNLCVYLFSAVERYENGKDLLKCLEVIEEIRITRPYSDDLKNSWNRCYSVLS